MTKSLLTVTAIVEMSAGLTLLLAPSLAAVALLGASLDAGAALVLARVAGAALLSLGVACWLARDDGANGAARVLVMAMLIYNSAAVAVLAYTGAGLSLVGVLLWPAVALHAASALWCAVCLRSATVRTAKGQIEPAK